MAQEVECEVQVCRAHTFLNAGSLTTPDMLWIVCISVDDDVEKCRDKYRQATDIVEVRLFH